MWRIIPPAGYTVVDGNSDNCFLSPKTGAPNWNAYSIIAETSGVPALTVNGQTCESGLRNASHTCEETRQTLEVSQLFAYKQDVHIIPCAVTKTNVPFVVLVQSSSDPKVLHQVTVPPDHIITIKEGACFAGPCALNGGHVKFYHIIGMNGVAKIIHIQ